MYLRVRKSVLLALSDVINTFVVAEKQHKKIFFSIKLLLEFYQAKKDFLTCLKQQYLPIFNMHGESFCLFISIYFFPRPYPLMLTKRSSAALWMWNTSSLNRQRQVELCKASFHRDNAAASLFSAAWHRIKPTERAHTGSTLFSN